MKKLVLVASLVLLVLFGVSVVAAQDSQEDTAIIK